MNLCAPHLRRLRIPATRAAALLGPIVLFVLLAPPAAKAELTTWTAGIGQWDSAESWNNGLPTTFDTAVINNGSTVSTPTAVTGNYNELQAGIEAGGVGAINVNGGLLSGTIAYLGYAAGATGSATVMSGTWKNTSTLTVGYSGTGTLTVNGGLATNSDGYLGYNTNSHGSATVTSGTWKASDLYVGYSGTGTLTVNGGTVTNDHALLGFYSSISHGSATVTSGTWNNTYLLYVGGFGTGTLTVNGGLVTNTDGVVDGFTANNYGSATVTGGTWNSTGDLYVGSSGTGTLAVDGGTVINTYGYFGYNAKSHGSATVTSGTWINTNSLTIGYRGTGTLAVNGGTVINSVGALGFIADSHGSATVTSGTWHNTSNLYVGYYGTGTLAVDGGNVTNTYGTLGYKSNSYGSATVTSGTWNNTYDLIVGRSGTGTLAVNGGLVLVSGTTFTGLNGLNGMAGTDTGKGTITLSGDESRRGVLETRAIARGTDSDNFGIGKVFFNGGVIRALANTDDFFLRYKAGDIALNSGGAFVDTNGFAIGINAPLGGEGALHKIGLGTLTLGGSNAYTGGTVVEAGTLTAAHQDALGTGTVTVKSEGTFTIQSGVTVANAIILEGGSLNQTVADGASLAGAINTSTTLGGATSAQLLGGTTSDVTTLQANFSATSGAENDDVRISGVFHLSGVHVINPGTGETDQFVLQLQVSEVSSINVLGWLDTETNHWVNAVEGNIGGIANFLGNKAYNAATDFQLGNYGFDTFNGTVWAVLNHNSDFAVVPEPGAWALLVLGAGAMLHRARKHQKV